MIINKIPKRKHGPKHVLLLNTHNLNGSTEGNIEVFPLNNDNKSATTKEITGVFRKATEYQFS